MATGADKMKKTYQTIMKEWKPIGSLEDLDCQLDNFKILFAYHSGKIENENITYHNTREIFENGKVINYTGDVRTIFEIENQKTCYEFLKEKIVKKQPLTVNLIKEIHNILMRGCYDERRYHRGERPGKFKQHDYVVGDNIGVPAEDVEEEIHFICEEIQEDGINPLTAAAYLHLNFESIHPFADGNGRVGRTIMNYYLMIHDCPPTIIYEDDKEAYYMALAIFDKTEEIRPFQIFMQKEMERTWSSPERTKCRGIKETLTLTKMIPEQNRNILDEEPEI